MDTAPFPEIQLGFHILGIDTNTILLDEAPSVEVYFRTAWTTTLTIGAEYD